MIKDCKVIKNNDAVTVFLFDDIEVQIPSIRRKAKTIRVLLKYGKYTVVDDDYVEPTVKTNGGAITDNKKKTNFKKTTDKESVDKNDKRIRVNTEENA